MHYEIRLYAPDALADSNRRASQSGAELETALGEPQQVMRHETLADAAKVMPTLPPGLTPLVYEIDDGGNERPVSVMELAQASAG
jgi:hypothetical protein